MGQLLTFILLFAINSCDSCSLETATDTTSLSMQAENTKNHIELTLNVTEANKVVHVADLKLRVNFLEQTSSNGINLETTITYVSSSNGKQNFTDAIEKPLTEFTNFSKIDINHPISIGFDILPHSETNQLKLNFELINKNDKTVKESEVEWVRSKIISHFSTPFTGKQTTFVLNNLASDIKPKDFTLELRSDTEGVTFEFTETNNSITTLDKLLKDSGLLKKEEKTNPITIQVTNKNKAAEANFSLLIYDTEAYTKKTELTDEVALAELNFWEEKVIWTQGVSNEETREAEEKLRRDKQEKEHLKQEEKNKEQEIKKLEEEIKQAKEKFENSKKELEEKKKHELDKLVKGENYNKKKKEIEETYNEKIKEAEETYKEIQKKDNREIKKDKEDEKEIKEQQKETEKKEKRDKKDLDNKQKEEEKNTLPKLAIKSVNYDPKDPERFTITLANEGRELKKEDLEKISLWYGIQNATPDDATAVTLEEVEKIFLKATHLPIPQQDKISLDNFLEELNKNKEHLLHFIVNNAEHIKSMHIVLHIEGESLQKIETVTINWPKKQSETK